MRSSSSSGKRFASGLLWKRGEFMPHTSVSILAGVLIGAVMPVATVCAACGANPAVMTPPTQQIVAFKSTDICVLS